MAGLMAVLVGCSQGLSDTDEQFRELWRDQDHASYTYRYVVSGMGGGLIQTWVF